MKKMAKTSAIQRNLKRIKMAKRFDNKRKKLKAIVRNKKLPLNVSWTNLKNIIFLIFLE